MDFARTFGKLALRSVSFRPDHQSLHCAEMGSRGTGLILVSSVVMQMVARPAPCTVCTLRQANRSLLRFFFGQERHQCHGDGFRHVPAGLPRSARSICAERPSGPADFFAILPPAAAAQQPPAGGREGPVESCSPGEVSIAAPLWFRYENTFKLGGVFPCIFCPQSHPGVCW